MDANPPDAMPRRKSVQRLSRIIMLVSLTLALFAAIPIFSNLSSAHAAGSLLSQGQPSVASSTESAGTPASAAFDGNTTTRWSSAFSDPQWIQVDLGATATINQVILQWESAYAKSYQIQVSNDANTWTNIYSTTTGPGGTETLNVTGTGRYVRMYGTVRATGYGYSLWEFQVYGTLGGFTPTPTTSGGSPVVQINAGGPAVSPFIADADYSGGSSNVSTNTISTSGVTNPAPQAVYQSHREGTTFTYTIPGLTANAAYTVRLHFAETYWTQTGKRVFNISINGAQVLSGFDVVAAAGGANIAVVKQFSGSADSSGKITLQFTATTDNAEVSGIEILSGGSSNPTPTPTVGTTPTVGVTPTATGTPPGNWTTIWSDNFTGNSGTAPSSSNWIEDTGTSYPGGAANWGTSEVETMSNSTSNVSLDGNGHLNITAINSGGAWTSGRIESQRSDFAAPAGGMLQISASIKQPNPANGLGYWPAFSAMGAAYRGNYTNWPAVGRMDILEDVNGKSENSTTLHCGTAPNGPCNEYNGLTSGLETCPGCQTAYHTYAVVIDRTRTDEQIRWYLDGQQFWVVSESQVGVSAWQAAVDHGFFLIFTLAIGGSFPNTVCGCTSPSSATSSGGSLSIDSVTVSQTTGTAPTPMTTPATPSGSSVVKVTGSQGNWQLQVNGAPYYIKGVTYGPPAADADAYMRDLQALGVNTVRTWGTDGTSLPLLNSAAAYGIKVINGFWINQGTDFINDTTYKTNTLNTILQWVNTYKSNPGVLMWDVGNEVLLTEQNTYSGTQLEQERDAYAQYIEQIVQAIHSADPNHPVTSTDAWTGAWPYYKTYTPDIDLYALNSYGAICSAKQTWISGGYTKPYIITETGEAGEWEVPNDANGVPTQPTDVQTRDGYTSAWNCITGHAGVALGGTVFNYGIENDFGGIWFNLTPARWKRLSYYAIQQAYTGHTAANTPPVISSLTLGSNSVAAGAQLTLNVGVSDPNGDPLHYNVMLNKKYIDGSTGLQYADFTQTGNGTFSVTAPQTMGVWKVYIYVYDGQGNLGVQSISFQVVAPPVNGTNVSKGKTTTASSYQPDYNGANFLPSNATDGNFATRWSSAFSDPQWLEVDLGQSMTINHVQLAWESAYATAYQIQISSDGNTWTTIYSTTSGDGGFDDLNISGTGRYVRFYGTTRATTYGYSLWEFGVYTA